MFLVRLATFYWQKICGLRSFSIENRFGRILTVIYFLIVVFSFAFGGYSIWKYYTEKKFLNTKTVDIEKFETDFALNKFYTEINSELLGYDSILLETCIFDQIIFDSKFGKEYSKNNIDKNVLIVALTNIRNSIGDEEQLSTLHGDIQKLCVFAKIFNPNGTFENSRNWVDEFYQSIVPMNFQKLSEFMILFHSKILNDKIQQEVKEIADNNVNVQNLAKEKMKPTVKVYESYEEALEERWRELQDDYQAPPNKKTNSFQNAQILSNAKQNNQMVEQLVDAVNSLDMINQSLLNIQKKYFDKTSLVKTIESIKNQLGIHETDRLNKIERIFEQTINKNNKPLEPEINPFRSQYFPSSYITTYEGLYMYSESMDPFSLSSNLTRAQAEIKERNSLANNKIIMELSLIFILNLFLIGLIRLSLWIKG